MERKPPTTDRKLAASQLARLRELVLSLPEVTEKLSHGAPAWFVEGLVFLSFAEDHHGDGRIAAWACAAPGAQAELVDSDPEVYFVPPYVGHQGWVGVRLDRDAPWPQLAAVFEAAREERLAKARLVKARRRR